MEKNNEIPHGWTKAKLSDLVFNPTQDIVDGPFGSNLKSTEYVKKGIPLIRLQNINRNLFIDKNIKYVTKEKSEQLKRHNFKNDDILITKLGEPLGEACLVPKSFPNGIIVADIVRIRLNHNLISNKFLTYLINSNKLILQFQKHTKGTTRSRVNLKQIRDFDVNIPPINEQKRIVMKIEELFSEIEHVKNILNELEKKLEFFRISLIRWIFFGNFKNKNYPLSEWKTGNLIDFFDIVGGGTPSTKNQKYWNGEIPWITSADIYGIRDIRPRRTVSELGIENSATHIIPKNSILVVTRVGLGKLAILETSTCINQDIQGLISKTDEIFPSCALHYLSEIVQIFKFQNRGTTIPGVTKKQLSELPFVLSSTDEQIEISNFIDSQLSLLKKLRENIVLLTSHTKNLKSMVLKKAFEGKIVPQDSNDEPASELLKQIKNQ